MNFKPMLSASLDGVDLSTLRYPLVLSPKLDGLRCIAWEGVAYSRNAKPLRNRFVQKYFKDNELHNLDGEIIVGPPTGGLVLERSKAVTAYEGEPDFTFHVFDSPERVRPRFDDSWDFLYEEFSGEVDRLQIVPHSVVHSHEQLLLQERISLDAGYEGVMLRKLDGPYKNGRSTLREGYLMKLKRFTDGEAVVVGVREGRHNANDLERDELGRAKRSFVKDGLVGNGMVGTLICNDPKWGQINVSPGIMTHAERQALWSSPKSIIGRTIHWRSFGYGTKDAPRFARYYGVKEDV